MIHFAGIDPGLDGALVVLDAKGAIVHQAVLPVISAGRGRRAYDVPGLVAALGSLGDAGDLFVTLEQALTIRGQGLASTAAGIGGMRLIEGIMSAFRIRYQIVHPRRWQKGMLTGCRAGDAKTAGRIVAGRLWPQHTWLRTPACTKPHQGMIDAALLAEYGRRVFDGLIRKEQTVLIGTRQRSRRLGVVFCGSAIMRAACRGNAA
jgi:hypothetical protein